jgi:phospholipid transport system substrate-binding protein
MKAVLVAVAGLLLAMFCSLAHAQSSDPAQVIRTSVDRVFEVLRDPALKKPEKRQQRLAKIRAIADGVFDWQEMAQSSLGVTYRKLNEQQRAEFVAVFKDLIAQEYMDDMDRFMGDEKVLIQRVEARGEQRVVKTVLLTHSRDKVPIDYFMHQAGGSWVARDFSIEGISLVNHYRNSFARFLANHTFEQLLERLRSRLPAK